MDAILEALLSCILEPLLAVLGQVLLWLLAYLLIIPFLYVFFTPFILLSALFGAGDYGWRVAQLYRGIPAAAGYLIP